MDWVVNHNLTVYPQTSSSNLWMKYILSYGDKNEPRNMYRVYQCMASICLVFLYWGICQIKLSDIISIQHICNSPYWFWNTLCNILSCPSVIMKTLVVVRKLNIIIPWKSYLPKMQQAPMAIRIETTCANCPEENISWLNPKFLIFV